MGRKTQKRVRDNQAEASEKKCPVCKKKVRIVGEGINRRYAQHRLEGQGLLCRTALVHVRGG